MMLRQRGFTLIEMAFVVAIIGLMVGGGIVAIGPITYQAKLNQTNTALDQIEASLVVFAIRNNRLPCPADGSLANTNANYGNEAAQSNNTGSGVAELTSNNCQVASTNVVIPWRTLGLDETYSLDGWTRRISYFPATGQFNGATTDWDALTNNGGTSPTNTSPNCLDRISLTTTPPQGFRANAVAGSACDLTNSLTTGTYGAYNLPTYPFGTYIPVYSINTAGTAFSTELTTANPAGNAVSTTTSANYVGLYGQRAAYVLISHGLSGWYGWTKGGVQVKPPAATNYTIKAYNSGTLASRAGAGSDGFVQGAPVSSSNQSNATYFDDIVRWRSPAFIIQQCGSGSCGNP